MNPTGLMNPTEVLYSSHRKFLCKRKFFFFFFNWSIVDLQCLGYISKWIRYICVCIYKSESEKHLPLFHQLCSSLCMDYNKLWKTLKEMGIPEHLSCLLRNLYAVQEAIVKLEPCMEQLTGSELRKEYDSIVCCHPVYLTYILSTSWEMPGWMSYKLESR